MIELTLKEALIVRLITSTNLRLRDYLEFECWLIPSQTNYIKWENQGISKELFIYLSNNYLPNEAVSKEEFNYFMYTKVDRIKARLTIVEQQRILKWMIVNKKSMIS